MWLRYDSDLLALPILKGCDPRTLDGFESVHEARRRRRSLANILGNDWPKLALRLRSCRGQDKCLSGACPLCQRRVRLRLAGHIAQHVQSDWADWSTVTIVSDDYRYSVGHLSSFDPKKMKDRLRQQLQRSAISDVPVYGGIDIDFDVGTQRFVPHLYLIVRAGRKACREAFERFYPATRAIRRPVVTRRVKHAEALSPATYMLKSLFNERKPGRDWKGNRTTTTVLMADEYLGEVARALDQWGFVNRIFQRNL
jgi:hypothetical protein